MFHSSIPTPKKRVKSVVFQWTKNGPFHGNLEHMSPNGSQSPQQVEEKPQLHRSSQVWLCPFSAKFFGYLEVSLKQCKEWMLFGGHVLVWNGLNPANPETLTCLVLVRYSICGDGNHIQSGLSHQHLTGSQPLRPFPKTLFFLDMSQFIHSFGSSSLLYCKRSPRKSSSSTMEPARVHPVVLYPVHLECYARTLMTKEVNWDDPFPKTHRPIDLYINNSTYIYICIYSWSSMETNKFEF